MQPEVTVSDMEDANRKQADSGATFGRVVLANTLHTYLWRKSCLTNIYENFKMNVPHKGIKGEFNNWVLIVDICNMTLE